jgi:hypothetical protein
MIKKLAASTVRNLSDSARQIHNPKGLADDMLRALAYENGQVRVFWIFYNLFALINNLIIPEKGNFRAKE